MLDIYTDGSIGESCGVAVSVLLTYEDCIGVIIKKYETDI